MTRDDIQTLLPFMANDTLTGNEKATVEKALASDRDLQAELDALRAVRGTMQDEDLDFTPGEMGLARLMREVDAEAAVATPIKTVRTTQKVWVWQAVAAAMVAVVVGQTALQLGSPDNSAPGADFTLASGNEPVTTTQGVRIAVGFNPAMTETELRALLLDAGVEMAAGPTGDGLYYVTPTEGVSLNDASDALIASDLVETLELP